jgi:hypothetical protein
MQSNEVSGRQCKKLGANVQALVQVYKQGDKRVLPTLFKFAYLGDFQDETLLEDPAGFPSALGQENDQMCGCCGTRWRDVRPSKQRTIRSAAEHSSQIPDTDANQRTAQFCIKGT